MITFKAITKFSLLIFFLGIVMPKGYTQLINWEELPLMPERVANNAVTAAVVDGVPYVYSFSGIDSTKSCDGDHLRSFRFNVLEETWETIEPLPDDLGGKIAAGASVVKDKIYIIGGYHLASNCGETSSLKTHIYDPLTSAYLPDGAPLLTAIDDQVQAVWRDSLIYVITGWSNTTNVRDVQIYNPSEDTWTQGTIVPNSNNWKVFGASGCIVGDTIYYAGGARLGFNFPASNFFRKGIINPENPAEIEWVGEIDPLAKGYRMGATVFEGSPLWIGGADITYNFDGIAYNGSGGVPALDRITFYDPEDGQLNQIFGLIPAIMDLRGVGKIDENTFLIAGGMINNQQVTNKVYKLTIDRLTSARELNSPKSIDLVPTPNPAQQSIRFDLPLNVYQFEIFNSNGTVVQSGGFDGQSALTLKSGLQGAYWIRIMLQDGSLIGTTKFIVQK